MQIKNNGTSTLQSDDEKKLAILFAACVSTAVFLLYIVTIPQDMVWGDTPELAASAWVLGVPHPTGYSGYMMAARLFQWIPVGTIAFRSHLFSAFCAAMACFVLFCFLTKVLRNTQKENNPVFISVFLTVTAFALTPVIWSQAVITEVYSLFVLQFVLALYLIYDLVKNPSSATGPLAFLFGLMIIHHRLSILLVPAIGIAYFIGLKKRYAINPNKNSQRGKLISLKSVWVFFIPLLLLFYYPLRAFNNPPLNWYDPDTLNRFYQFFSGEQYSGILQTGLVLLFTHFSTEHLYTFLILPFLSYSWLGLAAALGMGILLYQRLWIGYLTLVLFIIYQGFLLIYPVGDLQVFLIPGLILLTIPLSFGIVTIIDVTRHFCAPVFFYYPVLFLLFLCSLLPAFIQFDEPVGLLDRSYSSTPFPGFPANPFPLSLDSAAGRYQSVLDTSASDYATQVWHHVPPDTPIVTGLYYATADNEYYPLLYQKIVEGRGQDAPLIGAGFLYLDWYRKELNSRLPLNLDMRGDQKSLNREQWLEDTWQTVIYPLLKNYPVATTSHPIPPQWYSRCKIEQLGTIEFDRSGISFSYRRYIPFRYVRLLSLPGSAEKTSGTQG